MEQEVWKDIKGYEGLYQISNMGRVKCLAKEWQCGHRNKQTRIMAERIKKCSFVKGYKQMMLRGNGESTNFLLHRLVAITFIPNPENKPEVNHKNGDKSDNRVSQLEWATAVENMQHAHKTGLKKGLKGAANGCARMVLYLQTGIYYDCAKEAAVAKGVRYITLSEKLRGYKGKENNTSMIYV